jgi:ubiquinol-cytochrome c reductase cytochrome b subunit
MSFPWAKQYTPTTEFGQWMDKQLPLPRLVYNSVGPGYPAPRNLNYMWNFGSLAGLFLVIQIVTGIILAMHYAPNSEIAFDSVEHIMRDVNSGWMLRYAHANGASFFFIALYMHIARGLYYGSYKAPREMLWLLGVVIYLLAMATGFLGYVLPWGQMSFWGAKVITGLFEAIPLIGKPIQELLLGGFAPDNAALNRFFSLHYLLPFVIVGVVILHIWALHIPGSTNPTGVDVKGPQDTVPFHPYYTPRPISFRNGISGPGMRFCAPSPSTSSSSRQNCSVCWRCFPPFWSGFFCLGWTNHRCVRAASGPSSRCSTSFS